MDPEPKVPLLVSDLVILVNGEKQSCVTSLTVDDAGEGIVELHGGKSLFGKIDLFVNRNVLIKRLADSENDHA
ncbi:MAG: hypothetical protein WC869_00925 [Phycisphaerae bacterium]|jgi:hypothetical protein